MTSAAPAGGTNDPSLVPSGRAWVDKFPTSRRIEDLEPVFRQRVSRFLDALDDAGVEIRITATRRPRQRAYLMHYAWCIVNGKITPDQVPAFKPEAAESPVRIRWVHKDQAGNPSPASSVSAARTMVHGFQIANLHVPPSLTSLHITGKAIDMLLSWDEDLLITNGLGKPVTIKTVPRSGVNPELIKVGASYGVYHLVAVNKDPPHWSVNGH